MKKFTPVILLVAAIAFILFLQRNADIRRMEDTSAELARIEAELTVLNARLAELPDEINLLSARLDEKLRSSSIVAAEVQDARAELVKVRDEIAAAREADEILGGLRTRLVELHETRAAREEAIQTARLREANDRNERLALIVEDYRKQIAALEVEVADEITPEMLQAQQERSRLAYEMKQAMDAVRDEVDNREIGTEIAANQTEIDNILNEMREIATAIREREEQLIEENPAAARDRLVDAGDVLMEKAMQSPGPAAIIDEIEARRNEKAQLRAQVEKLAGKLENLKSNI